MPDVARSRSRRRSIDRSDPFDVLGVPHDADAETIRAARRELAKRAHPDAGGSIGAMQQLNEAARAAIDAVERRTTDPEPTTPRPARDDGRRRRRRTSYGGVRHDHPSFTIEALPAEAFEGVLLAAAVLGDVLDDDPPYLLEVRLTGGLPAWCRLELVPDAGSTTVSLTTARLPDHAAPDVLEIRDLWIDALNRVDWASLGSPRPS